MSWISGRTRSKGAMAANGSAASGRFVGAELVIDPIGIVFEPLEHSPAPFRSHLISRECIGDFVMSMLDWNGYRQQVLSGVGALGKLSPDTVKGYVTLGGAPSEPRLMGESPWQDRTIP